MTNEIHPIDSIVLLDGTILDCYPKASPSCSHLDNSLKLDTTGEYLRIGKHSSKSGKQKKEACSAEEMLFLQHAFLFYRNMHRILSDSRMFLAPVPVRSGLAYIGTSGFQHPTLGVYAEWWSNCELDMTKDAKGRDALTYYIAGSPLSGGNHCNCVYPDGRTKDITHYPFRLVWTSFAKINTRYDEAKEKYEAYTLQEVVDLLSASEADQPPACTAQTQKHNALTGLLMSCYIRMKRFFLYVS